ncbi:Uncharacterised protein [Vibrio cholerae]|nr:Uncharacterised protein [Vibrio cholerae]
MALAANVSKARISVKIGAIISSLVANCSSLVGNSEIPKPAPTKNKTQHRALMADAERKRSG